MQDRINPKDVACSLTDDEFRRRRTFVRETLLSHIVACDRLESGLRLNFADSPVVRSNVAEFVHLERQCCGFLTFETAPPNERLALTIKGPPEAQATLDTLAADLAKR